MTALDLSPLANAIRQFESALGEQQREPERTLLRDGLIQRFEFTYSMCERMLRRFLEASASAGEEIDESPLPFKVDLVELDEVDSAFLGRIKADFIVLA